MRVSSIAGSWGWAKLGLVGLASCGAAPCPVVPAATATANAPVAITTPAEAAPEPAARCPVWYVPLKQERAPVPARFSAEIPHDPRLFGRLRHEDRADLPPWYYLRGGVCEGDPEVLARLRASIERAIAERRAPEELSEQYGEVLKDCRDETAVCSFAMAGLLEAPRGAASHLYFDVLTGCNDAATARYFESADVPAARYIQWRDRNRTSLGDTPRLRRFVTEIVQRGPLQDVAEAASQLRNTESDEGVAFLLAVRRGLPDPRRRVAVGMGLGYLPKLEADYERSCKAAASIAELLTSAHRYCRKTPLPPFLDSPGMAALREYNQRRRAKTPLSYADRQRLARGLETCLETEPTSTGSVYGRTDMREECLSALGAANPKRARELATKYVGDPSQQLNELAKAIVGYADNRALAQMLTQLGLKTREQVVTATEPQRALALLDSDGLPNDSESPLAGSPLTLFYALRQRLPGLERLLFASETASGRDTELPRFAAYDGQHRYATNSLTPNGSTNLVSMLGFVNSLARSLGSQERVAIAAAPHREPFRYSPINFVFGTEQALCQLDEKRLLRLVRVSER